MQPTFKYYQVNDIQLHVAEAGEDIYGTIIFLHGFPEFWYGWRKQIGFFASRGYRVLAPDQRGYNKSSKPHGVKAYALNNQVQDIVELIHQIASKKIVVVGHDWGGAVAWSLAADFPEIFDQLVIINMPYPPVMSHYLKTNPKQMLKSWYAGFFQIPWVPEFLSGIFDFKLMERSLTKTSGPMAFTKEDISRYKDSWKQKRALTTMIHWYRAHKYNTTEKAKNIAVPTLFIWGRLDPFLHYQMAIESIKYCMDGKLEWIEDATHWGHHEKPETVNNLILKFI